VTGAIAVGGFFVALVAHDDAPVRALGRRFFLWGMIAAMAAGVLYLVSLGDRLGSLMRSGGVWALAAAIVAALGAMHLVLKGRFAAGGGVIALSIVGMVTVRHALRLITMDGRFDPGAVPVKAQWGMFSIFLVCFVLAVAVVWYVVALYTRAVRAPAGD